MKTMTPMLSLAEWTQLTQSLENDVMRWSQEQGWQVQVTEARMMAEYPREFVPRTLTIQTPHGRLMLEIPPHESDGRGRAKLYAWPTLYRVWLRHSGERSGWEIWTASGIPVHQDWGAEAFVTLANDLLNADE